MAAAAVALVALSGQAPAPPPPAQTPPLLPAVDFLVPGFAWRELPVALTNVNNVRYRDDGRLLALCYSGDLWLLDDADGDGLEERARRWWANDGRMVAPIGMALTPATFPLGAGALVACKGALLHLADRDGDDVAERVTVVADGWPAYPSGVETHGVDAVGVALAPDGRIFFGVGTANFSNPYLLGADGIARYDRRGERGAILELAADLRSRRLFCSGVRYPVGLAFDRDGALWATDQEGATWLADGNPFDELLLLQEGRHFGFPPRHPLHLPDVIDEPSVVDFAPQHQSTCGLCFNTPAAGGVPFGTAGFADDLFVCGYSRGTLHQVEIARGSAGPVARSRLFARFAALPIDVALSPRGALVVAAHGGEPDWGSGPLGAGRLFQLRALPPPTAPRPLFAWEHAADELRIAFDAPFAAEAWRGATARARVTVGAFVTAAAERERHRPGYAVVREQQAAPIRSITVAALRQRDGGRTLAVRLAEPLGPGEAALSLPGIDVAIDRHGAQCDWRDATGRVRWSGVLPSLDLAVARTWTAGSADHERLWELLETPGTLRLAATLDLGGLLEPRGGANGATRAASADERTVVTIDGDTELSLAVVGGAPSPQALSLAVDVATGTGTPRLTARWQSERDGRVRPLEPWRARPPWATTSITPTERSRVEPIVAPAVTGGDWARGRRLFHDAELGCARCHTYDDSTPWPPSGRIGPDLSASWRRSPEAVLHDLLEPNAAQNPDFLTYALTLTDGRELAGVPRFERAIDGNEQVVVGEAGGRETRIAAAQIVRREPLATSVMPAGLANLLSEAQRRDLLAYLCVPPLRSAPVTLPMAPPPRDCAEKDFAALLDETGARPGPVVAGTDATPPLRIVLAAGPKDHGVDEHDYPDWQRRFAQLLARSADAVVEQAPLEPGRPTTAQFATADVVVMYSSNPGWRAERGAELDAFLARGGGLVLLHWAINGRDAVAELARRTGLAAPPPGIARYRHGPVEWRFAEQPERAAPALLPASWQPLCRFVDETYWALSAAGHEAGAPRLTPLAWSEEEGALHPQLWSVDHAPGRVVGCTLGHYRWTFDDPVARLIMLRAIAWTGGRPLATFHELGWVGVRVASR